VWTRPHVGPRGLGVSRGPASKPAAKEALRPTAEGDFGSSQKAGEGAHGDHTSDTCTPRSTPLIPWPFATTVARVPRRLRSCPLGATRRRRVALLQHPHTTPTANTTRLYSEQLGLRSLSDQTNSDRKFTY
jgi:hypothetical protein